MAMHKNQDRWIEDEVPISNYLSKVWRYMRLMYAALDAILAPYPLFL